MEVLKKLELAIKTRTHDSVKEKIRYVYTIMCVHICTGLETIRPLVISTTDLVSKYPSPLKGIRAPWKNS